jgi:hypothetical protein
MMNNIDLDDTCAATQPHVPCTEHAAHVQARGVWVVHGCQSRAVLAHGYNTITTTSANLRTP